MSWKSITARKAEKQLFKEKGKLDNQKEVEKLLEQYILRFERDPKEEPELSRFHLFDAKGNVKGVRDMEIVDYLVENVQFFVVGITPYYYEHGVFLEDHDGVRMKYRIQKLIYRDQVQSGVIKRIYNLLITQPKVHREAYELNKQPVRWINFKNGYYLKSRSLIYAAGANHLKLGVKGEDEFYGKGVSYCATCDGAFYKGKTVTVVGGGDTAFSYALLLSKIAEKVYLVHRRSVFRANKSLQKKLKAAVNVEFLLNSEIIEIMGSQKIKSINLIQNKTEKNILTDGIFIAIGIKPNTALLKNKVTLDDNGYIIADENGITSVPGLFAAGDVRKKRLRQIVTAVSDGACCAVSAEDYLNKNNI